MKKIIIKESQLEVIKKSLNENKGNDLVKEQLFMISTLTNELLDSLENGDVLDDWMKSKIEQCEDNITNVVKSFYYKETQGKPEMDEKLKDLVIGK